jgi:PEGA domain
MKANRKPIFYALSGFYLVVCPLLILYSFGFFSDVAEPSAKTASLYLETLPEGASIFFNSSHFTHNTPTTLEPLRPGSYRVDLVNEGYGTISYALNFASGQQSAISKALFVPKALVAKRLIKKNFQDLIPLPSGDSFILREGDGLSDYFIYNLKDQSLRPLTKGNPLPTAAKVLKVFTSPGSSSFFMSCNAFGVRKYIFLNPDKESILVQEISALVPAEPYSVLWDPSDIDTLFVFVDDYIDKIDLKEKVRHERYFENVRGFGIYQKHVYILTDINNVEKYDYPKENLKTVLNDPVLGNFIFGTEGYFRIEPLLKDTVMFFGEKKGELSLSKVPHRFVRGAVKGTLFNEHHRKLLFWQDNQIGMINLDSQVSGFDKTLSVNWFFKGAKEIKQGFWVYDTSHVLARDRDQVFLFDLNNANLARLVPIALVKSLTSVYYDEGTGVLYYLEPSSGNLLLMQIIPSKH